MTRRVILFGDAAQCVDQPLQAAGYSVVRCDAATVGDLHYDKTDLWLLGAEQLPLLADLGEPGAPGALGGALVDAPRNKAQTSGAIAIDPVSAALFSLAKRVAGTGVSVLLSGESGSGKEVLARFIHRSSPRRRGPFCAINCAAIPDSMLEAELFGHEKGAFTGAISARQGKFEQAHGGTLLLDEVTEMPVLLQAKLLRALQEKEVERLGGRQPRSVDVRVIATTNRDAKAEVAANRLREDLYYRLNVFPLHAPALRDRPLDIPALLRHFVAKYVVADRAIEIAPAAMQMLCDYHWPGNVRELENVVQRALVLVDDNVIQPVHVVLGDDVRSFNTAEPQPLSASLRTTEHAVIAQALKEHENNRSNTAAALGISERTLRHKLQKLREQGVDLLQAITL